MLDLRDVSLSTGDETWLLREIEARFPAAHLCAVLGPSGSGKSTLLKVIAGLREPDQGTVHWGERNLAEHDLAAHEIGYVPQFSIAFDLLSVYESVEAAMRLRVGALRSSDLHGRVASILLETGLTELADRRVGVLSGGQKRRLALALEMVSSPLLLLCDEVTSGLDAKSENEIVALLKKLSRDQGGRAVLSVTHSLRHLKEHDSVAVMHGGRLVFHGPPELMLHYFSIENAEQLFPRLLERSVEDWGKAWAGHRRAYYASLRDPYQEVVSADEKPVDVLFEILPPSPEGTTAKTPEFHAPAWLTQVSVLLVRRAKIFVRDRGQLALQLALLFGFPFLVVIFAWDGLPQIQNLSDTLATNPVKALLENATFSLNTSRTGGLVSGLVMFQVILLTLMGSNNAAREIAGERQIFEKEKFAGLRASSYLASKAIYLCLLAMTQSVWMGVFVNIICRFPGDFLGQLGVLVLVNLAMTAVCLGISSLARTPEQASLLSVYLVGFQLPLSGAVLALPHVLGWLTRPFIAAFWGWSGFIETMRDARFYDIIHNVSQTELVAVQLCCWALASHMIVGLLVAYFGCKASRWE